MSRRKRPIPVFDRLPRLKFYYNKLLRFAFAGPVLLRRDGIDALEVLPDLQNKERYNVYIIQTILSSQSHKI